MKLQNNNIQRAVKIFTDRENPRNAFWENYELLKKELSDNNGANDIHIIDYYGVGGIGKSKLLNQLEVEIKEKLTKPRYLYFDFKTSAEPIDVLNIFKTILSDKYKFTFPLYDIALYCYAEKSGIKSDTLEIQELSQRSPILSFLINCVGTLDGSGILSLLLNTTDKGIAAIRKHIKTHSQKIKTFSYMSKDEIERELPLLFAQDFADNIKKTPNEPFVFMLDTYELMVNELNGIGDCLCNDLWLRGYNGLIQNMPNVLWVISGREKLKWEAMDSDWSSSIEFHLLDRLSEIDSEYFLESSGINDKQLQSDIYKLTDGTPFYLDLCVDTYYNLIQKGITPKIELFGNNSSEIVERFVRYMDDQQKELVYVLSYLELFDDELVNQIKAETLPNLNMSAYHSIVDLSFVTKNDDGSYCIQKTFRKALVSQHNKSSYRIMAPTGQSLIKIGEALLHNDIITAKQSDTALDYCVRGALLLYDNVEELYKYYNENIKESLFALAKSGKLSKPKQIVTQIFNIIEKEQNAQLYANMLSDVSYINYLSGDYVKAEQYSSKSLEILVNLFSKEHPITMVELSNYCITLEALGLNHVEKTESIRRDILDYYTKELGSDNPETLIAMSNLANTLIKTNIKSKITEAVTLLEYVVKERLENYNNYDPDTISAMHNLANAYISFGDYEQGEALSLLVFQIRSKLLGNDHQETLGTLYNLGFAQYRQNKPDKLKEALKNLETVAQKTKENAGISNALLTKALTCIAAIHSDIGNYQQAVDTLTESLELSRKIFGESSDNVLLTMNNLSIAYRSLKEYEKAINLQKEIIQRKTELFGENHRETLHARYELALTYFYSEQYSCALELHQETYDMGKDSLKTDDPYAQEILKLLVHILNKMGKDEEFFFYYLEYLKTYGQ